MEAIRKKIKLVVSDLHIGQGSTFRGGYRNPLEEFNYDEKFAELLRHYSRGSYEDCSAEIILNGDILNLLQVDYKGHYPTVITENISLEKVKRIVKGHPIFFEALRKFASRKGNKISFIVGNHDQGMLWPKVRAYLDEVLNTRVYHHNIAYSFDGFHIEHGHMYERANRFNPRKLFLKKDLPEPILNLPFGSHFFIEFVLSLKKEHPHIDKIRPFRRMVRWCFINETFFTIKSSLFLLWYLLRSIFFTRKSPYRGEWSIKKFLEIIVQANIFSPDLTGAASSILSDPKIHTVIFGHSHVYKYRQLENGEYFNTGTWIDITSLDISFLGRLSRLTYVLIEYPAGIDGSQPRARLKHWIGRQRIEEDIV